MSQINGRRVLAPISTVLALVCGMMIATVPPKAEALYAGPWSITMVSEREFIGAGAERVFDDSNAELTIGDGGPWFIRLTAEGGWYGDSFDFEFEPSYGHALSPGWYPRAQRAGFQASGRPGMDIDGDGRGCNSISGNFEVRDIAWSSTGTLQRLWLIYEQHCDEGWKALFGEIRLGVPVGAADVEPDAVRWPEGLTVASTEPVPIVVRQTSAPAVHVSGATLVGAHPQDFNILSDRCSGQTLTDGDWCVVFVRFTPTSPGARSASLRVTTDAATLLVGLDGHGMPGVTDWKLVSEPGDDIGEGKTYEYAMIDILSFAGSRQSLRGYVQAVNGDWWNASFLPGEGDILVAGETYADAHEDGSRGPGPEMGMFGNGRSCLLTGSFTVNQLDFLPDTTINRLDLTFEQRCDGDTGSLRGRIRHRARDDITPPTPVTGLSATRTTGTAAHLEWTNPADSDYVNTVVRYLPGSHAPRHPTVGHLAHTGTGTSLDVSGLTADRAYTFGIFTYDATGNASRVRVISIPGLAKQTITAAPTTLTYGSAVSVHGVLTDLDGVPLDAHTTRLQTRAPGSATWAPSSALTTSSDGSVDVSITPSASRDYRLISDTTPAYAASASTPVFVTVHHKVTAALNDSSIGLGQTVTIRGSVAPNHQGKPVYLQRYYSGAWHTMKTATLSSTSTYSFSYQPGSTGTRTLRVYRPADADHAAGASPTLKLTITK